MEARHRESVVLFYNVSKKSNAGPIVRSAGAFGVSRILVVGDSRSKIKFGSQGTHTRIPFEYFARVTQAVDSIKEKGFKIYGVEIDPTARAVDDKDAFQDDKICFLFGNEGDGLNSKAKSVCDAFIRIKQFAPRIESLNVAVAAGIVLHAWAQWANLTEVQFEGAKYCVDHDDVGLLIGSYTSKMGHVNGQGKGVYKAALNPHTGVLTKLELLLSCSDPSYVALIGEDLFVAVDEGSGALHFAELGSGKVKQTIAVSGKWPCHVFVDDDDVVTVSGYGGTLMRTRLSEKDQMLEEPVTLVTHDEPLVRGSRVNEQRQQSPHVHCFIALDEEFGVAVDLGADALVLYETRGSELVPAKGFPVLTVPGGPRHAVKHPHLALVGYVVSELSNEIFRFSVNVKDRSWELSAPASSLPHGVADNSAIAAVVVTPNGEFCFVSNRFHDSITTFAVAPDSGALSYKSNQPCGGQVPRDMTLLGNSLLIVANQNSSNISVFVVGKDGTLTPSQQSSFPVPTPSCVKIFN